MKNGKRTRRDAGFSLVELMVVVAIIGVLGSIVAYNVIAQAKVANQKAAKAKLEEIAKGVETYKIIHGRWPQSVEELIQGEDPMLKGGMKALLDPWGTPVQYAYDGLGTPPFDIVSLGADKAPGGVGEDTDIHYREAQGY